MDARQRLQARCQGLADALQTLESEVLALPPAPERRQYLAAVHRLMHVLEQELHGPLTAAMAAQSPRESVADGDGATAPPESLPLDEALALAIDAHLLEACTSQWHRAARVAGTAVGLWPDLPVSLFAQRLQVLINAGRIEVRGDILNILQSEVRRTGS